MTDGTAQRIEDELRALAGPIEELEAKLTALYLRREQLVTAARALRPPMTYPRLARAVGTSEGAIAQLARRIRLRAAELKSA